MIDIQYIRENPEIVKQKSAQKGYDIDVDRILSLDSDRKELLQRVEELRRKRNANAEKMKSGVPDRLLIDEGKQIKIELSKQEDYLVKTESQWMEACKSVPNMPLDSVPVGDSETGNVVEKTVGEPREFDFTPKDDEQIGRQHNLIDKQRAAKIAGSRFAYIKGDLVRLQFALVQWVMDVLGDEEIISRLIKENDLRLSPKPFVPVLPPAMLRTEPYEASARLNAEEVTYKIEQDDLWLNASAEHTLCTMYWNEVLPEAELPIRYIGYATSFRREAGTYGKDSEGIFRMHQFDKLEMETFSTPETGLDEHRLMVSIQEYLMQSLNLPYRLIRKCTADIGKPNASGLDIDCWMPAQGEYRETHTADYMTDYQARDLKIRVKRRDGQLDFVHTNDATAFALGRIMKAIIENNQDSLAKVVVPDVLRPYMSGRDLI